MDWVLRVVGWRQQGQAPKEGKKPERVELRGLLGLGMGRVSNLRERVFDGTC